MSDNIFKLRNSTLAYMGDADFPERVTIVLRRGVVGSPWVVASLESNTKGNYDPSKMRFEAKDDLKLIFKLQEFILLAIENDFLITVNIIGCPPEVHGIIEQAFELGSKVCIEKRKALSHSLLDD